MKIEDIGFFAFEKQTSVGLIKILHYNSNYVSHLRQDYLAELGLTIFEFALKNCNFRLSSIEGQRYFKIGLTKDILKQEIKSHKIGFFSKFRKFLKGTK